MATQNIALRISGTKVRKAGFSPLVTIGVLPTAEESDLDRALQVGERPGFIIKHTNDYISYRAIDCHVRSIDADASGMMSIAITIPSDMQLANGASPYNMLMEIYTFFKANYMSPLSDGRDVFINTEADAEQFRSILGRYALEKRTSRYVPMNPAGTTGRIRLPESKLADFFRDSQYPELAQYKDVEIGTTGDSSPSLETLQVPRPKSYKLKINGVSKGTVSNPVEPIAARALPSDKEEYTPVSFSINELMENGGLIKRDGAIISLDTATETIDCNLERNPITYRVHVNWQSNQDSADMMRQWMQNGEITIHQNNKNYTKQLLDGTCRISANDVREPFRANSDKYRGHSINIKQNIQVDKREVVLSFSVTQERRTYTPGNNGVIAGGNSGNVVNRNNVNRTPGNNFNQGQRTGINRHEIINDQKTIKPSNSKGDQQKAFYFGILIGFILGIAVFYAINTFALEDKQAETEKIDHNDSSINDTDPKDSAINNINSIPSDSSDTNTSNTPQEESADGKNTQDQQSTTVTENNDSGSNPGTGSAKDSETEASTPPKAPSLEELTAQLVKAYNKNSWSECQEIIKKNNKLKKYKSDMESIFRIRQNIAFDSQNGFKKPELNDDKILSLQAAGYISGDKKATEKFKISNIDEISTKKEELNSALSDF